MNSKFGKVLITGASGQLAQALMHSAPAGTECVGLSRAELDIADEAGVQAAITSLQPDCVINGAAYNLVDKAEGAGMEAALRINALGVARLAKACRDADIPLVHFSTDFVFDGEKRTPYTEADATHPLSVYGASKLAGENIALAASPLHFAIRVCRLFGPIVGETTGSLQKPAGNFPLLMLRLGQERESLKIVSDQIGSPSYTPDLARGIWQLITRGEGGLYQLSNAGEVSFDEYARAVFKLAGINCRVESVTTQEYGAPAHRPLYSTLNNAKAHATGVTALRHWHDALTEFVQQL
ncbi:MAG: dTDP-4-dehydrorhamnose reductase [Abitibacteriaceae bacterium]|nr:dTDP-4-dehydrorhamnose reductase [Abditibacteriaceae bacterium]